MVGAVVAAFVALQIQASETVLAVAMCFYTTSNVNIRWTSE